jgi:hypothetical protein
MSDKWIWKVRQKPVLSEAKRDMPDFGVSGTPFDLHVEAAELGMPVVVEVSDAQR